MLQQCPGPVADRQRLCRIFTYGDVRLVTDEISYEFVRGARIDYVDELIKAAFEVRSACVLCSLGVTQAEPCGAGCGEPQRIGQLRMWHVLCAQDVGRRRRRGPVRLGSRVLRDE